MNKKVILIVILLIGLGGAIGGYMYYNKGHRDIADEKPAFTMESTALFSEFENTEAEATKKYMNKVISLSGKVGELIVKDTTINIVLRKGDDFFGVNCSMSKSTFKAAKMLKVGGNVKLKGVCDGYLDDVVLSQCVFE